MTGLIKNCFVKTKNTPACTVCETTRPAPTVDQLTGAELIYSIMEHFTLEIISFSVLAQIQLIFGGLNHP